VNFIVHVDAWFESANGKDFRAGLLGGCGWTGEPPSFAERIHEAAVLLRPGDHLDGSLLLQGWISKLPPGAYRIEAKLGGWKEEQFSGVERIEISKTGAPFLTGGLTASSTLITVTH